MRIYLSILLATVTVEATAHKAAFEAEGLRVEVSIASGNYIYEIANNTDQPLTGFAIGAHATHLFAAPDNWHIESSLSHLKAWTDDPNFAVFPTRSGVFSFRVSSQGAVLGRAPLVLTLASGRQVTIPNVLTPAPEPRTYIFILPVVLLAILALTAVRAPLREARARRLVHPAPARPSESSLV